MSDKEFHKDKKLKHERSFIDRVYLSLLKDPSSKVIVSIVTIVFIIWMVIPLLLVLSGAVYFNNALSLQPIANTFQDKENFNLAGDQSTSFFSKEENDVRGGYAKSIAIKDNYVFIAEQLQGIEMLDISDPHNIQELAQYSEVNKPFNDLVVFGSYLISISNSELYVFNITNIDEDIVPLYTVDLGTNKTNFMAVNNDNLYVCADDNYFHIFDISDVENNVTHSYSLDLQKRIKTFDFYQDYLIVGGITKGISIFDVTDPTNPDLISNIIDFTINMDENIRLRVEDIAVDESTAYIALGGDGILSLNISTIDNLTQINYDNRYQAYEVKIIDTVAVVSTKNILDITYKLELLNIENNTNYSTMDSYSFIQNIPERFIVSPDNNTLYLAMGRIGLVILDISDNSNISFVNEYQDPYYVTFLIFVGVSRGIVFNSIMLGIVTTLVSIILGVSLAFILARYEFPAKKFFSLLALAPLIIPPFISGFGFNLLLGPNGLLNILLLEPLFSIRLIIRGFVGICFVQSMHFFALIYLNSFSSFVNIDPSMEEQAENLGASSFRLFRTVTLPLAMPGIGAGAILVLILSMEDVGTPIVFQGLGDPLASKLITYSVFVNLTKEGSSNVTPEICVQGGILLVLALVGFFVIRKYVSLRQYAMISKGRAGKYRLSQLRWKSLVVYPYLVILFLSSLMVHLGVILGSLVVNFRLGRVQDIDLTLDHYKAVFLPAQADIQLNISLFAQNTLFYSVLATILIILLGTSAAYVVSRKNFKGKEWFDALITIPIAIPGLVLALGYYMVFDWGGIYTNNPNVFTKFMMNLTESLLLDPFQTIAVTLVVLSYTIRKFPFTVRAAYAGLQQTDVILEEASMNLGANRTRTFAKITVPLISLNVFAGSIVSFIYCLSEVSTTILVINNSRGGTITWVMARYSESFGFQIFCVLGVFLMILQIISLFITNVVLGSRTEAITGI